MFYLVPLWNQMVIRFAKTIFANLVPIQTTRMETGC